MPEPGPLAALRRDVDRRPDRLKTVLRDPQFRKEFLKGAPNDDKKTVKAFADMNSATALKTKPLVSDVIWSSRPDFLLPLDTNHVPSSRYTLVRRCRYVFSSRELPSNSERRWTT